MHVGIGKFLMPKITVVNTDARYIASSQRLLSSDWVCEGVGGEVSTLDGRERTS